MQPEASTNRRRRRRVPSTGVLAHGFAPGPKVVGWRPGPWLQPLGLTAALLAVAGGLVAAMLSAAAS